ncbi:MAG TPA: DUF1343 domain-containing protein [Vicinamibacterales bacterium]|jgi:uncharacterized protein YbbC (DUF1343 family)|nr:DUF1343 domain-containing protein [Vicinamibacterales bacterium]
MTAPGRVTLGSERLLASGQLKKKRVGIVSNPASVNAEFQHIVALLARAPDVRLAAIFGPQHGYRADVQDNMIQTGHSKDALRRVPVYSLYSETREPTAEMLKSVDVLVVDLQDVGARIYTFIYTMANCLRGAKKHGVPVIVCDRPNPIGGVKIGGPMLRPGYESFVGQFPIPLRHGMTIGELARFFNDACGIGADLTVMPLENWKRPMHFDETGLAWVMPSPNMPTLDTAIVYSGTVLIEGTNISEGRGTTRPFELIGAPWVDPEQLAEKLAAYRLPGVHFRPAMFEPTFQKHARTSCGGCQIHVLDRNAFKAVESAVAVLTEIRAQGVTKFQWRQPPYEYEEVKLPFDILAGSGELRQQVEAGLPVRTIYYSWEAEHERFAKTRAPFLLY